MNFPSRFHETISHKLAIKTLFITSFSDKLSWPKCRETPTMHYRSPRCSWQWQWYLLDGEHCQFSAAHSILKCGQIIPFYLTIIPFTTCLRSHCGKSQFYLNVFIFKQWLLLCPSAFQISFTQCFTSCMALYFNSNFSHWHLQLFQRATRLIGNHFLNKFCICPANNFPMVIKLTYLCNVLSSFLQMFLLW